MTGTEAAFDEYAEVYDAHFTHSSTGVLQRKRVWNYLTKNLSPEKQPDVLEVNCGTGEDALWLSRNGFSVTATDGAAEMVQETKRKLQQYGFNSEVFRADLREIKIGTQQKFDVIFSDFGGMNCLSPDELKGTAQQLSDLLKPNGRLLMVIMGRNCKWEQFYFKRKNDRESAFRRQSKTGIEAVIFGQRFSTWYYSPEEIAGLFSTQFSVRKFKPIGISLPPSYLESWFRKKRFLLGMLNAAELFLGQFSALSDKADHFIIDLQKKGSA